MQREQLTVAEPTLPVHALPRGPASRTLGHTIGVFCGGSIGLGIAVPGLSFLAVSGAGALVVIFLAWAILTHRAWKRFAAENNSAVGAMGQGDLVGAHATFARWANSRHPWICAMARHNIGCVLLTQGRLSDAASVFVDVAAHYERALVRVLLLRTTRNQAALCYALLGQLEAAHSWLQQAELPMPGAQPPGLEGSLAMTRAIIACRTGGADHIRAQLEQAWDAHEGTMPGSALRLMRVVRAYVSAAVDGPRNFGNTERILADLKPRYPNEFTYIGSEWPEMAAFLAAHQLSN